MLGSYGSVGELKMEVLAVQILAQTVHMFEVSLGKTLNPKLLPIGLAALRAAAATHGYMDM